MPITESATSAPASQDNAPTGNPTSSIANDYDATGKQVVEDGVFDFDAPEEVVEDKPFVQELDEEEDPFSDPEPVADPAQDDTTQPTQSAQSTQPTAPQTELKLYAEKFKTPQDLKNAYVELGGDPAKFGDNIGQLEEAYRVRQSEYSRVRAQISHGQNQPQQPAMPQQTFQEILNEEFAKYDPSTFASPADMWKAQTQATAAAAARFEAQQARQMQQPQITPQEMDRQIKIVNNVNSLEKLVPRLRTDQNFRKAFATHIHIMRDEGRMPTNPDGTQDLKGAMKDFIQGQSGVFAEVQRSFQSTQDAKQLSTATGSDHAQANPASAPRRSSDDVLVDELLDYKAEYDRKYS